MMIEGASKVHRLTPLLSDIIVMLGPKTAYQQNERTSWSSIQLCARYLMDLVFCLLIEALKR